MEGSGSGLIISAVWVMVSPYMPQSPLDSAALKFITMVVGEKVPPWVGISGDVPGTGSYRLRRYWILHGAGSVLSLNEPPTQPEYRPQTREVLRGDESLNKVAKRAFPKPRKWLVGKDH